ncbi:MAG: AAA family ATPase [Pseudomonadota bacterium]
MKIHQLTLRNWRGVQAADLVFGDGVTVIEGPNEIGKSSIVEALLLLFNELDSSKKKAIQAVKPVDVDAGSEVSAEISAGQNRFVYGKTFNKTPSTTLRIIAPEVSQMTGREAHDQVNTLLSETVDMTLWQALLVNQGESLAAAELRGSGSLLKALDEAAGTAGHGDENPDLFAACQAEYERYFTLKTGRPKFLDEREKLKVAKQTLDDATQAMAAIAQDVERQERCQQELDRLQAQLPELTAQREEQEQKQRALEAQRQALVAQQRLLDAAAQTNVQITGELAERERLADEITLAEKARDELRQAGEPGQSALDLLEKKAAELKAQIAASQNENTRRRELLRAAEAELQNQNDAAQLAKLEQQLAQVQDAQAGQPEVAEQIGALRVTQDSLTNLRTADRDLELARTQLAAAVTIFEVAANRDLKLAIDHTELQLIPGQVHRQPIDAKTAISLPGIADLELIPPASADDLRARAGEANEQFRAQLQACGVASIADAETQLLRKTDLERKLEDLKTVEKRLLGDLSTAELRQKIAGLTVALATATKNRHPDLTAPENMGEAERILAESRQAYDSTSDQLEQLRAELDGALAAVNAQRETIRDQERNAAVQQSLLKSKREDLKRLCAGESNASLNHRARAASVDLAQQQAAVQTLSQELDQHSPEAAQALLENAVKVHEQVLRQLDEQRQTLAVYNDRLENARADGRFETLENAQRDYEFRERQTQALSRRAEAAKLLWTTLSDCREHARQAYLEPMSNAVRKLGQIVFGNSFGVELGDDWTITHRELNGKRLPVESLSVGAQEQLSLLTRLAAAQIVSSAGGVPVIFDDALGFADPQRLNSMGAAFAAAGRSCQVIVLTCTPGRFQNIGGAGLIKLGE